MLQTEMNTELDGAADSIFHYSHRLGGRGKMQVHSRLTKQKYSMVLR